MPATRQIPICLGWISGKLFFMEECSTQVKKECTLLYFKYIYISDSMLKMYSHKLYFLEIYKKHTQASHFHANPLTHFEIIILYYTL